MGLCKTRLPAGGREVLGASGPLSRCPSVVAPLPALRRHQGQVHAIKRPDRGIQHINTENILIYVMAASRWVRSRIFASTGQSAASRDNRGKGRGGFVFTL